MRIAAITCGINNKQGFLSISLAEVHYVCSSQDTHLIVEIIRAGSIGTTGHEKQSANKNYNITHWLTPYDLVQLTECRQLYINSVSALAFRYRISV